MRRTFYIALGATAGVLIVRRLTRAANKWTPEGLAAQAGGLGDRVAAFSYGVRRALSDRREAEVRKRVRGELKAERRARRGGRRGA